MKPRASQRSGRIGAVRRMATSRPRTPPPVIAASESRMVQRNPPRTNRNSGQPKLRVMAWCLRLAPGEHQPAEHVEQQAEAQCHDKVDQCRSEIEFEGAECCG